jgi:hypothetical protein
MNMVSPAGAHQFNKNNNLIWLTNPESATETRHDQYNLANLQQPDRPPDKQRKTAGRAGTLLSGNIYSVAAIHFIYDITDSCASAKSVGGAK